MWVEYNTFLNYAIKKIHTKIPIKLNMVDGRRDDAGLEGKTVSLQRKNREASQCTFL